MGRVYGTEGASVGIRRGDTELAVWRTIKRIPEILALNVCKIGRVLFPNR